MPQRLTPNGKEVVRYRAGYLGWYSLSPFAVVRQLPLAIPPGYGKHAPLDIPVFFQRR